MKQCLALAAALVLAMPLPSVVVHVEGQVVFQREPVLRSRYQPVIEAGASTRWHFSTFSLPPFIDNRVLAAQELDEDAEEFFAVDGGAPVSGGFYRFGEDFAVDLSLADGTWYVATTTVSVWLRLYHTCAY